MARSTSHLSEEEWQGHHERMFDPLLVGRENELEDLTTALRAGANVLVTGPWGSGKTTLVRRALEALVPGVMEIRWFSAPQFIDLQDLIEKLKDAMRREALVILDDLDRLEPASASQIFREALRSRGRVILILDDETLPLPSMEGPVSCGCNSGRFLIQKPLSF